MNSLENCLNCEGPLNFGHSVLLNKKGYYNRKNLIEDTKCCLRCYENYCYFCNNYSSNICSYCDRHYCKKCAVKQPRFVGISSSKCLECDKCKYNLMNIDCNNRNTLDNCKYCDGPLKLGHEIFYTKEKGYYVDKSFNTEAKCCLQCKEDYCYFCNNFSDDACTTCDKSYCVDCAKKWEKETCLAFMWGDLNNCVFCAQKNKNFYLK